MTLEAIVSCSWVGSAFVSSEQDLDQANIGILLEQVGGKLCRSTGRYALARLANLGDQCPKFGIERTNADMPPRPSLMWWTAPAPGIEVPWSDRCVAPHSGKGDASGACEITREPGTLSSRASCSAFGLTPKKRSSVSIACFQAASPVRTAPTATMVAAQGNRRRRRKQSA